MKQQDRIDELELELEAVMQRSRSLKAEVIAEMKQDGKPGSGTRPGC